MTIRIAAIAVLGVLAMLAGCAHETEGNAVTGGVRIKDESEKAQPSAVAPARIYVYDFMLDAQASEHKSEVLERPHFLRKIVEDDPATRARKLVDSMADALVKDLRKAGLQAQRLSGDAAMPREGWLVRGAFTEADTGDAPRRAIIGFGAGKTDMEVQVGLCDLATNPQSAFAVFGTVSDPSRLPGGAVTRNPYMVAAKFVLEKNASGRDVDHTAHAIADEIVKLRGQVSRGELAAPKDR